MNKNFNEIFDYVKDLTIIDSHEHLPYCEDFREKNTDALREYLIHYFSSDLISAGLNPEDFQKAINHELPIMDRWDIVEPFWNNARYTGYGRDLDISVKAIYNIDKISKNTIEELDHAFQRSLKPGHFKRVLKDMSKIEVCLLDSNLDCDPYFFKSVYRLDRFIYPQSYSDIKQVEEDSGIRICSMDDWLEACEMMLDKAFESGAVALKSGLAYDRTLKYERTIRNEAEVCFNQIFNSLHLPNWDGSPIVMGKEFQDYMMHFILRMANKRNPTFQFHTGLQEGNGNYIHNSDPSLLSNLFLEYPDVDFDIFHIGYPYQHVLSALAKNFPNVYIDMCWAHIISPYACVNALNEWIDSVPLNKIIAFGGDYMIIDAVYGHQYLARTDISKSLAHKVEEGVFDIDEAKRIAKMLFYGNPKRIFKLDND
ncbi:MAG: amidohydrolase family protein [Clostridiales bacterium]|nr:amidohydrolase family protein [Clostridiales bacterium]